jgi:hypothetical protein
MGNPRYTVVTGYWAASSDVAPNYGGLSKPDFYKRWFDNTVRWCDPCDIVTINHGSPALPERKEGKWLDMTYDSHHMGYLMQHPEEGLRLAGCTLTQIEGLIMACNNGSDLVFKEQDVLMAGRCVDAMYDAMGAGISVCCGKPDDSEDKCTGVMQAIECSLFLVKRDWLLEMAESLLSIHESDAVATTEQKWLTVHNRFPGRFRYAPFGFGRCRRFNLAIAKPPFYVQRLTEEEMGLLQKRELL